ncbi:MAG: HEAT repeat domain-containing protein [Elusimicrobia bacterium]|nr:HEAT repeat domain-containing protein [Elusimicrobiota bacterium]MDE2509492.1 HEAT repeat domain-containing protein [Elusimicrobiota bacterium]
MATAAALLLLALSVPSPAAPVLRPPLPVMAPRAAAHVSDAAFPSAESLFGESADPLDSLVADGEDLHDAVADVTATGALQAGLRSPSVLQRLSAIRAAAVPRGVSAVPYLSAAMLRYDEPARIRAAAALALGRIDDRVAVSALAAALNDPAPEVRYASALSLGRLPADGVATRLGRVLQRDPVWQVRYAAAIALGRTHKSFVSEDLAAALENDPAWQIRQQAARSLQDIPSPRSAQALTSALRDPEPSVRAAAGSALAEIGGPVQRRAVADALRDERDPSVRAVLAVAARRALSRP